MYSSVQNRVKAQLLFVGQNCVSTSVMVMMMVMMMSMTLMLMTLPTMRRWFDSVDSRTDWSMFLTI